MNNTPRTDSKIHMLYTDRGESVEYIDPEDCRQLETELNAAKEENERLKLDMLNWASETEQYRDKLDKANAKIAELRRTLEEICKFEQGSGFSYRVYDLAFEALSTTPPQEPMVQRELTPREIEEIHQKYEVAFSRPPWTSEPMVPWSVVNEILEEHFKTMREVSDVGYSDGLCLKPSMLLKLKSYAPHQEKGE